MGIHYKTVHNMERSYCSLLRLAWYWGDIPEWPERNNGYDRRARTTLFREALQCR